MSSEFEKTTQKYAELIVKVGLNLQPGQRLLNGLAEDGAAEPVMRGGEWAFEV